MPENLMSSKFFTIKEAGAVNVIELTLPDMLDSVEFDKLNEAMLHLFDGRANEKWVLDLSQVEYVGSAVLGLMVNIRQHVKAAKGKLVICALSKTLGDIFRASSLERLFTITKTRAEAIKAV
jgi:anti-sigma B factor antagonist